MSAATIAEVEDARMLQEPADDRAHPDILGEPRHSGPQCAYATNDQVDFDAGLRCAVKRFDHLSLKQGIHLGDDMRALATLGKLDFVLYRGQHAGVQCERCLPDIGQLGRLAQAGQLHEYRVYISADTFVRGHQAEIGIKARGAGMIVAGPQMDITPQPHA